MTVDKVKLKALAEAATPGPWIADNSNYEGSINSEARHVAMASMYAKVREDIPQNFANQEFIAAANPAAVLELIAEIDQLKAENEALHAKLENNKLSTSTIEAMKEARRGKLASFNSVDDLIADLKCGRLSEGIKMPKGKTTLYFHGGPANGLAIEAACNRIYSSLRIPSGSGFTEESDGRIGVFTHVSELPENWTAYKASNYDKEETASGQAGVVYSFTESLIVDRCRAITKKGDWYKNESADGKSVCKTHALSEKVELRPI